MVALGADWPLKDCVSEAWSYTSDLGGRRVTAVRQGVYVCGIVGEDALGGSSAILPFSFFLSLASGQAVLSTTL